MKKFALLPVVVSGLLALGQNPLQANPTGGAVSSGSATINTVPGTVTVNQSSNLAIINWQTFSIASGETTKFVQPSSTSAALNRVLGGQTSIIDGTLSANGSIYLINGNGIVVGSGGVVSANSFIASTRDIADADFLSGNLHFTGSNSNGVQNLGTINALGDDVYLIGKTVDNEGTITASNGTAGMASGDDVVLNLSGQQHVFVNPSPTATSDSTATAVKNGGTITAASAELAAANGNMYALAINNGGTIRATAVAQTGGHIYLTTDSGSVVNTGTMAAKSGSNGGQVSVTGGSVWNQATIDASGAVGGTVAVDSEDFQNDGTITAAGTSGAGGSVSVTYSGNALGSTTGVIDAAGTTAGGSISFDGTGSLSLAYLSLAMNVSSSSGTGGSIDLVSPTIYLTGASLNADGATAGGRVFVGESDPNAADQLTLAQTVYVSTGSSIEASATSKGNGGTIGMLSSNSTEFLGTADVMGAGSNGGGGLITLSGTAATYDGGAVSYGSSSGKLGTFALAANDVNPNDDNGTTGTPGNTFEFVDPDPAAGNMFGQPESGIFNFATNTTLITSPGDSFAGAGAGAVYLFSDANGALISTLRGSTGDHLGTDVQTFYSTSDFAVVDTSWNGGMGAVTLGADATGFANGGGNISASNSLVGSTAGDMVGSGGLEQLDDGNFIVNSPSWSGGDALTWISAANGIAGAVSTTNSLVGSSGEYEYLSDGNLVVLSPNWNGGAGAVTFFNETTGTDGLVSAANSVVGAAAGDEVGSEGITQFGYGGNYLISSPLFNGSAGAVTFCSGTTATVGVVSATNSLVGATPGDAIGSGGITQLYENGVDDYLVLSPSFAGDKGAVTWGSGTTGVSGVVSATNSLVGATAGDAIGSGGVTTLYNYGTASYNYVVDSPLFASSAGAVTWGSGTTGISGVVSASNSLVGAAPDDGIGSQGVFTIYDYNTSAENYLVLSPSFASDTGAVTFGNGTTGVKGVVSASNSLVGAAPGDEIGASIDDIVQLDNGANYLVLSPSFGGGLGAITDCSAGVATVGVVSPSNSLIGASTTDGVGSPGSVTDTDYGYYLVSTPGYGGGAGAVTWNSETAGAVGVISSLNSLVGGVPGDAIGSGGITVLYGGNYVVNSPNWNGTSDSLPLAGAVTFGLSSTGVSGLVSASNSLVGAASGDEVGSGGVLQLNNGSNYLILSPSFGGGAGAITNFDAFTGVVGTLGASNSLVGSSTADHLGSDSTVITQDYEFGYYLVNDPTGDGGLGSVTWNPFGNATVGAISATNSLVGTAGSSVDVFSVTSGNYFVTTSGYGDGEGAVTFGKASTGVVGTVGPSVSLVGASSGDDIGSGGIQEVFADGTYNYLVLSPLFGGDEGAVTFGSGSTGVKGIVSAANSLVGAASGDAVGSPDSITTFYDNADNTYNYLVTSTSFDGNAGAVTWGSGTTGVSGVVSASNSLVGAASGDSIGSGGIEEIYNNGTDNYLVLSPGFDDGAGAVTFGNCTTGVKGVVSASNSLVGATGGEGADNIGSGGIEQVYSNGVYNYLVLSPSFDGAAGAVTWGSGATGVSGVVSATNSLVGATAGDQIGGGGVETLYNGNYLVLSPDFGGGEGAVTFGNSATGVAGTVGASNSLIGASTSDGVGGSGIVELSDGNYLVETTNFNGGAGAVTWGSGTTGVDGVVSATNSLVGAASGDAVGSGGVSILSDGNYLVLSPDFGGGAGAVTWGSEAAGVDGVIGATNSLVGASTSDHIDSGGITYLSDGNFLIKSPDFDGGAGAITFGTDSAGVVGTVSSTNSLVGATGGDDIGSGGIVILPDDDYLVLSPLWDGSTGAATWGSSLTGVTGVVGTSNSITGGGPNAGLEFAGYTADESYYLLSFTTDTSLGGDGRVFEGSIYGSSFSLTTPSLLTQAQIEGISTFSTSGFDQVPLVASFFVSDPESLGLVTIGVDSPSDTGGATNTGTKHGHNIASGSSLSNAPGTNRLVTPGNGVWNIFGGLVHQGAPPSFVVQQLQLNLSPAVYAHLQQYLYGAK